MNIIEILTTSQVLQFHVHVATSKEDREKGLMGIQYLPDNEGMIFPQSEISPIRVWMKGTLIPLDIIFIDENGSIIHIDHSAEPQSERMIWSNADALCFLELAGGTCHRQQIEIGDIVLSPILTSLQLT